MKTFPTISLITPSFNQADFIEATLRSVLEQSYPGLQYIIVDGGSTDGSVAILEHYRRRIESTGGRVIIEPDRGQADAINKGLCAAKGEIVGWLCSDDLLLPGALHTVGRAFATHDGINWLAGACRMIKVDGSPLHTIKPTHCFDLSDVLLRSDDKPFNLPQPAVFWRRRLHEWIGLLDETRHYCMDFEFWLRLLAHQQRPHVIEDELAAYRLHDQSKTCSQRLGFVREHIEIEAHYARDLPWRERLTMQRRLGYMRRAYAIAASNGWPIADVLRRPWWLLSQQVRQAIFHPARAA